MVKPSVVGLLAHAGLLVQLANGMEDFQQHCESFTSSAGGVSFTSEYITSGTELALTEADATCGIFTQSVSVNLCRITAQVPTSNRSGFWFEAWLPEDWSGRFLATGNGGLGGCIQYYDVEYGASLGFATIATNNGHQGYTGSPFLHNLDVIQDFAYRSIQNGVVVGKEITQEFYGEAHEKSYYLGCSTGGRQGLKAVQSFPDLFDGVVVGAPAIAWNNLTSWAIQFYPLLGTPESATFVPLDVWPIIHQDILDQCDQLDGVADGILESPNLCNYNPDGLLCTEARSTGCLTSTQLETLKSIYSPVLDAAGSLVYPKMQLGSEFTGAVDSYFSGAVSPVSDWYRYAILNDSNWDAMTLRPENYTVASGLNHFNIDTWDGDLSAFQNRGGKLLHWHGLADGVLSSENSPRYYEHVSQTMGMDSEVLDEFYRFFRISGMSHCGSGNGATFIGHQSASTASLAPEENVLMAMVRWVESEVAPETIMGTRYKNGTSDSGVDFRHRHYRWPYHNVYQGIGYLTLLIPAGGWPSKPGLSISRTLFFLKIPTRFDATTANLLLERAKKSTDYFVPRQLLPTGGLWLWHTRWFVNYESYKFSTNSLKEMDGVSG
ncbi:tannase and feruloyl esterase [Colletotrichum scovillei]|uniref:Carboxylic ester hydrolase n=1 Tax=Colletotrichum scovillei TaxID=1209932 RepID=A0A9P7UEF3_9PEZI|nr:tannase and feruloyl esterase [Colletotrichum scovillei]KAG7071090.1 tannase and feruloyl esterase [Colletotrichum scovillei]